MSDWFGEPWPSGVCEDGEQKPTPTGVECLLCDEKIVEGDRGVFRFAIDEDGWRVDAAIHRECDLRSVTGGIEHLTAGPHAVGSCYEGSTLSYRQSALQAWEWVMSHGMVR